MERHDNKNKHRISDARWRDSVSRCYHLLKQCSYAEQETTRMSILKMTLDQIQATEQKVEDFGWLPLVRAIFEHAELTLPEAQN